MRTLPIGVTQQAAGGGSAYLLECQFTDTNGTLVDAYTPDSGTYYGNSNNGINSTQIYNNTLAKGSVSNGNQFTVLWSPTGAVTTIEADIEVYEIGVQGMQGLFVRATGGFEGYTCYLYNQNAMINKSTPTVVRTNLSSVSFPFTDNTLYHFKIVLTGNQIDFYIDDALITSATDATYNGSYYGYAGWFTQSATANQRFMDNLIAY